MSSAWNNSTLSWVDGLGLERFYQGCGWQEIGRWPAALRLHQCDDRAEVLMFLPLHQMP